MTTLNELKEKSGVYFYVEACSFDTENVGDNEDLASCVIDALKQAEDDPAALDFLSFDVFRCAETGEYRVEAFITLGGPSVGFIYDSREENAQIVGYWGGEKLIIREENAAAADYLAELAAE